MKYYDYLQSETWAKKRENVLIFWGHRCAICFSPDNLHVHHRTYERLGHEILTDLIVLCSSCHELYTFNGRGNGTQTIQQVLDIVIGNIAYQMEPSL